MGRWSHFIGSLKQKPKYSRVVVFFHYDLVSFYLNLRPRSKQRLSRLRAAFWWTAIYHVEVKGQPNCPAHSSSGASPGRCLGEETAQLTAMEAECRTPRSMFAVLLGERLADGFGPAYSELRPAEPCPACQTPADVKAGVSPRRREAGFVMTVPSSSCRRSLPVSVFQRSALANLVLCSIPELSFSCSVMDQRAESLINSGLFSKLRGPHFLHSPGDAFPSSGVQLAVSGKHQSTFEKFKWCQSQKGGKKTNSKGFCFPGRRGQRGGEERSACKGK